MSVGALAVGVLGRWGLLMVFGSGSEGAGLLSKLGSIFRSREFFIHDGASMRRFHVSTRMQIGAASAAGFAVLSGIAGVGAVTFSAVSESGSIATYRAHSAELAAMQSKVDAAQSKLTAVTKAAKGQATMLSGQQEFLTAMLQGEDIAAFPLDVHMSVLEGSAGFLPRRLMVLDRDLWRARIVLADNDIPTGL